MIQQSMFSIGNKVQVIDYDEHPSEWAVFMIIQEQINSYAHRYCLVPPNKYPYEYFWVSADEICPLTLDSER